MEKELIGKVTHFFPKISVAVIKLDKPLKIGDKISIEGATTNFQQEVSSMQINHEAIEQANANDEIGLKVIDRVREGDNVYLLKEE